MNRKRIDYVFSVDVLISFSVVIPCFNNEDTIVRAVSAALNQKLAPREIIVVDDCSVDRSVDLLEGSLKMFLLLKLFSLIRMRGWNC